MVKSNNIKNEKLPSIDYSNLPDEIRKVLAWVARS